MLSYNRPTATTALLNRAVWLAWVDHPGLCVVSSILNRYSERRWHYLGTFTFLRSRTDLTCKEPQVQKVLGSPYVEKDKLW
ncbi:hypothetical protein J6590_091034 [Homalodisca vitripennis]|nr:hypothetical protein J6590_091034 [Homalodisca vitripennis]